MPLGLGVKTPGEITGKGFGGRVGGQLILPLKNGVWKERARV